MSVSLCVSVCLFVCLSVFFPGADPIVVCYPCTNCSESAAAGHTPNRPPYLNNGWDLRVVQGPARPHTSTHIEDGTLEMSQRKKDEEVAGMGRADEYAGGAGCEYIRVRHRDDPEAELFLFRDGLVLYGCEDPINRWRGAGVTLLPAESARVREVSRHEGLQVMQRLGLRRDPPADLHLYKLGLPESKPLDGPFDPENPPPWAVYYRNFKDRTEPGFWGEYQHHEDPGWQEYVLRCWDKDSASEEDSDGLGRLPPVLVSEEANEREEAMHVFPRKSKRLPRHASHPVREGVGFA